mmetsp:Transcript_10331/g.32605  ORF Transcript_10331/g.32605 Transcript_10331/m.32605 type:complete len:220 (+) Transcript_10331:149-808(+)
MVVAALPGVCVFRLTGGQALHRQGEATLEGLVLRHLEAGNFRFCRPLPEYPPVNGFRRVAQCRRGPLQLVLGQPHAGRHHWCGHPVPAASIAAVRLPHEMHRQTRLGHVRRVRRPTRAQNIWQAVAGLAGPRHCGEVLSCSCCRQFHWSCGFRCGSPPGVARPLSASEARGRHVSEPHCNERICLLGCRQFPPERRRGAGSGPRVACPRLPQHLRTAGC